MKPLLSKPSSVRTGPSRTNTAIKIKSGKVESKTPGFMSKAAKETAKKAAEAEKHRLAAEAEAAKLAAERAEKERLKATKLTSTEDKRADIVKWLQSVPLSETSFKRIDRAFSDGCLVAEIINYFCPNLCDKRQYFKWVSNRNKITNWEAMNYKVFPKLGFKLSPKQINNLLRPWLYGTYQKDPYKGFYIFQLLAKLRDKLGGINPSVYDYRRPNFHPPKCNLSNLDVAHKCGKAQSSVDVKRRRLSNLLEEPVISRIEKLLNGGFYDKKVGDEAISTERTEPIIGTDETVPTEITTESQLQEAESTGLGLGPESFEYASKIPGLPSGGPLVRKMETGESIVPCPFLTSRSPYITSVDNWADAVYCQSSNATCLAGSCFLF